MKNGYAPVNGLNMYFEIHGVSDGKSPPLLLLHGGGSTIETSFSKVLPVLAQSRQLIAVEQQGHGRTADVDRPFSFTQSSEDTVALLRHLGIEKVDILGYSNGGQIGIQMAIDHPGLVRKLIVESVMFNRDGAPAAFWEGFEHAKIEQMPAELRDAYFKVAPQPKNFRSFFEKSVNRMKTFKGWPPEQIQGIRAPTLIVIGDQDIVRPEHAVQLFRLLPHGALAILPNTDHMKMVADADKQAVTFEAFLNAPMP